MSEPSGPNISTPSTRNASLRSSATPSRSCAPPVRGVRPRLLVRLRTTGRGRQGPGLVERRTDLRVVREKPAPDAEPRRPRLSGRSTAAHVRDDVVALLDARDAKRVLDPDALDER